MTKLGILKLEYKIPILSESLTTLPKKLNVFYRQLLFSIFSFKYGTIA